MPNIFWQSAHVTFFHLETEALFFSPLEQRRLRHREVLWLMTQAGLTLAGCLQPPTLTPHQAPHHPETGEHMNTWHRSSSGKALTGQSGPSVYTVSSLASTSHLPTRSTPGLSLSTLTALNKERQGQHPVASSSKQHGHGMRQCGVDSAL